MDAKNMHPKAFDRTNVRSVSCSLKVYCRSVSDQCSVFHFNALSVSDPMSNIQNSSGLGVLQYCYR